MDIKTDRIGAYDAAPGAMAVLYGVEKYISNCGQERSLIELVKMLASKINSWNCIAIGFRYQHP